MRRLLHLLTSLSFILVAACSQGGNSEITDSQAVPTSTAPAGTGDWWRPTPGTSWQIQLQGELDTSIDAQVYDIDLFDTSQASIDALHAQGRKVICYFSAGSFEDWRSDAVQFPKSVLGKDYEGWEGERWLDISQIDALAPIMRARLDLAAKKKCDAVDPDNVDGYSVDSGFSISENDQLTFNRWLANEAHQRGMAIGLKNDGSQVAQLVASFDFVINESCFTQDECADYLPFIAANKPVWNIEYEISTDQFCAESVSKNFDSLKKDLDLQAPRQSCR